ncbi:DNA polymerase III subunit delta' [Brevirhabdus sp.]|uniref:DNA polymerase III subunit delta' n=1 Tax=Brevirhabdus sp. TaxID=2004514 RepID=UPI004058AAA2
MSGQSEPDRVPGAPHPRNTQRLFGQQHAEQAFLEALNEDRLHHGWLITGPQGVGKATLAWRIARYLRANPPAPGPALLPPAVAGSLDVGADHPVSRRIAALSEPGLFLLRRPTDAKTGRIRQEITVDEVRRLKGFASLSATDGGRRVVIVDSADALNTSAANALLKLLEEPPADTVILMVSHQPSRLLPTIRSRCRVLRCHALPPDEMAAALHAALTASKSDSDGGGAKDVAPDTPQAAALAELAGGSVGRALQLLNLDGLAAYGAMVDLFAGMPRMDRGKALALADKAAARGAEDRLSLTLSLFELFLSRLARSGVAPYPVQAAKGESTLFARLCPSADAARAWAELAQTLSARAAHGRAVNLDPAALILDMVFRIDQLAARWAAR